MSPRAWGGTKITVRIAIKKLDRNIPIYSINNTIKSRRQASKRPDACTYTETTLCVPPHIMDGLFCSLAVLDPRVGHIVDVLSPFISALCHSD